MVPYKPKCGKVPYPFLINGRLKAKVKLLDRFMIRQPRQPFPRLD